MLRRKQDVLASIKRSDRVVGGKAYKMYAAYLGTRIDGSRIRIYRTSRDDLEDAIADYFSLADEYGGLFTGLTPRQLVDVRTANEALRMAGIDAPISDCVREYLERHKTGRRTAVSLRGAYEEYHRTIPAVQALQRQTVANRVGAWAKASKIGTLVGDVTAASVAEYLTRFDNPKTYNNNLSYIKTFLNWCAAPERRYVEENPCALMRNKQIAYREPSFMPLSDVRKMFAMLEGRCDRRRMLFAVLSFFMGIRSEEIARLSTSRKPLDISCGSIRIAMPKGWTRGMVPRVVPVPENAVRWIEAWRLAEVLPRLDPQNDCYRLAKWCKAIGVRYPRNAGRHTFVTMHVAAYDDGARTEHIAGTSKAMRTANYMGLANKKDALAYFAIVPSGEYR